MSKAVNLIHALSIALAGVMVFSWRKSITITKQENSSQNMEREATWDNSLQQIESDLKDILSKLKEKKFRTIIVLEELDKIDDNRGQQLDAVIRYFKNLFTQAPALFFFLTDK